MCFLEFLQKMYVYSYYKNTVIVLSLSINLEFVAIDFSFWRS